jgi:hypothetical protein
MSLLLANELPMTVQQLKELRLQCRAGAPRIEVRQERVVGFLQHGRGIEARRYPLAECRFADTYRAFDCDIPKVHGMWPMLSSANAHGSKLNAQCPIETVLGIPH